MLEAIGPGGGAVTLAADCRRPAGRTVPHDVPIPGYRSPMRIVTISWWTA